MNKNAYDGFMNDGNQMVWSDKLYPCVECGELILRQDDRCLDCLNPKVEVEKIKVHDSFEEYLNHPYIQSSNVVEAEKSPLHYWHSVNTPKVKEETEAQRIGTALHCLVLERENFVKQYTFLDRANLPFPDKDYRTIQNKTYRENFLLEAAKKGLKVLDENEWELINGMANSILANEDAVALLKGGEVEMSHYMYDEEYDLHVKIRPDIYNPDKHLIVSLKTSKDGSPEGFARECVKHAYDVKEAFYARYMGLFYDRPLVAHAMIVVENKAPYYVGIYDLDTDFMEVGDYKLNTYLNRIKISQDEGKYKGYEFFSEPDANGIISLKLPKYAIKDLPI